MESNSFLDKGIILGYCFYLDPHYRVCHEYIHQEDRDYYATEQVQDIFENAHEGMIRDHRSSIQLHLQEIISEYEGTLSSDDIESILEDIDRYENDAWRYLEEFYEGKSGESVYEISSELRDLVRDIESMAKDRKKRLYSMIMSWIRISSYDELHEEFADLKQSDEEDFWILIDAHDLGANTEGSTEFATPNPADFDSGDIRERIENNTAIDEVVIVAVSRSGETAA